MEYLNTIWNYVLPVGAGVTVGAIIVYLVAFIVKRIVNKAVNRIDEKRIAKDAADAAIDHVKTISFEQSIQPVCESELIKINEAANKYVDDTVKELKEQNTTLINLISILASYFDNAIGIPEEKKEAMRNALKKATAGEKVAQRVFIQETTELPKEPAQEAKYKPETAVVER